MSAKRPRRTTILASLSESDVASLSCINCRDKSELDFLLENPVRPSDRLGHWVKTLEQRQNGWKEHAIEMTVQSGGWFWYGMTKAVDI